jgi:glucoamylase
VTPSGFGQDIASFVQVKKGSEPAIALSRMFLNIDPALPGAVEGVVVAGRSGPDFASKVTNYEFDWVRDSSLTMDVVQQLYCAATNKAARQQYESTLFTYAAGRAVEQNDPSMYVPLSQTISRY